MPHCELPVIASLYGSISRATTATIYTSLPAYTYNSTHPDFKGPHKEKQHQHVYPPRLHFQRLNEEEQHQQVNPPGPSSSHTHYTTLSVPQTISSAESSLSFSYSHATYLPTTHIRLEIDPSMPINASGYVFPPSPTAVPGRSGGTRMSIDEDDWRKLKVPKVYPVGRFVGRCKGSEALKVHVSSGTQAVSARRTSTESLSPLSDLPVLVPLVSPCTSTRES